MKFGRFEQQGRIFFGSVDGETVTELDGSPFESYRATAKRHDLSALKVLLPFTPVNFYCAGLNYAAHVEWGNKRKGTNTKLPEKADVGYRSLNALIASGESIVIPADSPGPVQFEGELVAVIGKTARHLSEADALNCVLGYTLGNDLSERTWQKQDRTLWRAKNTDTFKPMGPWIETELKLPDLVTRIRLNGRELIQFPTNHMIFGVEKFIATMSRYLTLHPGDVIWMGTEGETADMKHGDTVEVEITGIGTLRNPVVREGS
jgi:2-keto-4-pentenoate hydratase/2-oxohepta-3-ene-1,7-dioic acid hydratase in catechol pathway